MKGQNCSSILKGPEHWPNPGWPLIRAINPQRGKKGAPEGLMGGVARGEEGGRKMKNRRTGGQEVFNCKFFHLDRLSVHISEPSSLTRYQDYTFYSSSNSSSGSECSSCSSNIHVSSNNSSSCISSSCSNILEVIGYQSLSIVCSSSI